MYFFQPFRCKKSNEITKSGSICLFQKLDSSGAPKPTLGPKTPLKYPRRAEIGINASHAVQLTSFGPKKPDSNRSPQRSVPFTWNHPRMAVILTEPIKSVKSSNPQSSKPSNCYVPPLMGAMGVSFSISVADQSRVKIKMPGCFLLCWSPPKKFQAQKIYSGLGQVYLGHSTSM